MFKRKNVLLAVAVSVLLAACGGSDDPAPSASTGGTNTPAGGGNTTVDNSLLAGTFTNVGDQLLFSETIITSAQLASFPGDAGPFAKGTNSPLSQFGIRLTPLNTATAAGQSKTARVGMELVERAASVGAGEQAETFQIMVNQVTMATDAAGALSVAIPAGSRAYIYYRPKTGAAINVNVDAAGLVSLAPVDGDTTSNMLVFNLEAAVTRALGSAAGLGTLKEIAGKFDTRATVSNVAMTRADETTPLTGTAITVTNSGQPAVTGSGVAGVINVE